MPGVEISYPCGLGTHPACNGKSGFVKPPCPCKCPCHGNVGRDT